MLLQIFTIVTLLAVGQSILLAGFLWAIDHEDKLTKIWLTVLLFDFGIGLLGTTLIASGYYHQAPHLLKVGEPLFLVLGPALYFYIQSNFGRKIDWKIILHFIPFILYSISLIPFYIMSGPEKNCFHRSKLG